MSVKPPEQLLQDVQAWWSTAGGRIKGPMPPEIPFKYVGPAHRRLHAGRADPKQFEEGR